MSLRHPTAYGPRQSDTSRSLDITRRVAVSQQIGGKAFGQKSFDIRTWICGDCGLSTPEPRLRCKWCGQEREGRND